MMFMLYTVQLNWTVYNRFMTRLVGTRAGLTREAVVDAAFALLHENGLEGVSMRRIAERVGVAPNAIYTHIPDKSALLDELVDGMLAGVPDPDDGNWRERILSVMRGSREQLLRHPDLIPLALTRQSVGPNALRLGEHTLRALADAGVHGPAAVDAMQGLLIYTIGSAAFESGRTHDPDPAHRRQRGRDRALAHGGVTADLAEPMARFAGDAVFEKGITALIDGFTR
jgi:TetR/AcrR family transcriptional regulator, tetracycline repressor protein